MTKSNTEKIYYDVQSCTICEDYLPLGVRPILQIHSEATILIVGQAPGKRVHETGIPFDDPSGDRLRNWMGVDKQTFYNPRQVAIVPMGFCYPGTGKSGDLPPRKECAKQWREIVLGTMPNIQLTLVIGQYALDWHLNNKKKNLTETVKAWKEYWPTHLPLPHPSPRNNIWLRKNQWFIDEVLPNLKKKTTSILKGS